MKRVRSPEKFKAEAVKQVSERGHGVVNVAKSLGMSDKSPTFGCPLLRSGKVLAIAKGIHQGRSVSTQDRA